MLLALGATPYFLIRLNDNKNLIKYVLSKDISFVKEKGNILINPPVFYSRKSNVTNIIFRRKQKPEKSFKKKRKKN